MLGNREEHVQFLSRSGVNTSSAPAYSGTTYGNGVVASSMATSAEYFPNVIDTSTSVSKSCLAWH